LGAPCANGVTQGKVFQHKNIYFQIFLMIHNEYLVGTDQVSLEKEKKGETTWGISKIEMGITVFEMPRKFAC
jgi:hypothetical protein